MDATKLIEHVVSQGVLGVLLVLAVLALWKKDRELSEARKEAQASIDAARKEAHASADEARREWDAARKSKDAEIAEVNDQRVEDAKALGDKALAVQERAMTMLGQFAKAFEAFVEVTQRRQP